MSAPETVLGRMTSLSGRASVSSRPRIEPPLAPNAPIFTKNECGTVARADCVDCTFMAANIPGVISLSVSDSAIGISARV